MTIMQDIAANPLVTSSAAPEGLSRIHREECAAAIWSRDPSPAFQAWVDALDPDLLPRARLILRPHVVRQAMTQICDQCGTPEGPERTQLIDDIAALSQIFADLMNTPYLRVRLDVINTNACRKFHIDAVTARLICTYRGTGTQYGVGPRGGEPDTIATTPAGRPIVLRGTLWPNPAEPGLLHRSPPIEGSGETRLVLVLDPIADGEAEKINAQLH